MDDFNPGDGWREVKDAPDFEQRHLVERGGGDEIRYWVREEPVPPLPTATHTVIKVHWDDDRTATRMICNADGSWSPMSGGHLYAARYVQANLKSWDLLASPESAGLQTAYNILERAVVEGVEERRRLVEKVLKDVAKVHRSAGDLSVPARFADELSAIARKYTRP